jgi:hypothetical protein
LRLEYRRKLIYYNVDIKNGGTRSRFTMFEEVLKIQLCYDGHLYTSFYQYITKHRPQLTFS